MTENQREFINIRVAPVFQAADAYIDFIVMMNNSFPIEMDFTSDIVISADKKGITKMVYIIMLNFMVKIVSFTKNINFDNTYNGSCTRVR
jgi:hypothetical protein